MLDLIDYDTKQQKIVTFKDSGRDDFLKSEMSCLEKIFVSGIDIADSIKRKMS